MKKRFFGFLKPQIRFDTWTGEVRTLPPPDTVTIPLSQPGRMPFNPIVSVGDTVETGQFIALLPNRTGVHATVTGTVTAIGPGYNHEGREILTISIRRDSEDVVVTPRVIPSLDDLSRDELIAVLAEFGFGSPWKPASLADTLTEEEKTPIHTVIILAVDEEPPIAVQRRFLTEFAGDFAESVTAIRKMAGDARLVVAVPERMMPEAKKVLSGVELFPVGNTTLDTNATLLVQRITGKFFTAGHAPRADGIVVFSAEDVAFAARCLHQGKSRTNSLVTVSAPELPAPVTVRVRLGTPVGHILETLEIPVHSGDRVIFGGPLTGYAQPDLKAPVSRAVNGVTVIRRADVIPFSDAPCINCGRCVAVCPVHIQVNLAGRYSEFGLFEKAVQLGADSCVECGLCAYICPSRRPLMQYMKFASDEYAEMLRLREEEGV